jgi:hypothetical protein
MLKEIRILGERDKAALRQIFEYLANQSDTLVQRYSQEMQRLADMADISQQQYELKTGLYWEEGFDLYDQEWYEADGDEY